MNFNCQKCTIFNSFNYYSYPTYEGEEKIIINRYIFRDTWLFLTCENPTKSMVSAAVVKGIYEGEENVRFLSVRMTTLPHEVLDL